MKFNILIADDDQEDKELFRNALSETEVNFQLSEVSNGEELIEHLRDAREEEFPNLIFLDLNMPVMDGRTALLELRKEEYLREIPVIILSTSNSISDVKLSYNHGANLFFVKPDSFFAQVEMLKQLFNLLRNYTLLPRTP